MFMLGTHKMGPSNALGPCCCAATSNLLLLRALNIAVAIALATASGESRPGGSVLQSSKAFREIDDIHRRLQRRKIESVEIEVFGPKAEMINQACDDLVSNRCWRQGKDLPKIVGFRRPEVRNEGKFPMTLPKVRGSNGLQAPGTAASLSPQLPLCVHDAARLSANKLTMPSFADSECDAGAPGACEIVPSGKPWTILSAIGGNIIGR